MIVDKIPLNLTLQRKVTIPIHSLQSSRVCQIFLSDVYLELIPIQFLSMDFLLTLFAIVVCVFITTQGFLKLSFIAFDDILKELARISSKLFLFPKSGNNNTV